MQILGSARFPEALAGSPLPSRCLPGPWGGAEEGMGRDSSWSLGVDSIPNDCAAQLEATFLLTSTWEQATSAMPRSPKSRVRFMPSSEVFSLLKPLR